MSSSDESLLSPSTSIESLEWDTLSEAIADDALRGPVSSGCQLSMRVADLHCWLQECECKAYEGLDTLAGWEDENLRSRFVENKVSH